MCHLSKLHQHQDLIEGITFHCRKQQKAKGSWKSRSMNTCNQMSVIIHYIIHFEDGGKQDVLTTSQKSHTV